MGDIHVKQGEREAQAFLREKIYNEVVALEDEIGQHSWSRRQTRGVASRGTRSGFQGALRGEAALPGLHTAAVSVEGQEPQG